MHSLDASSSLATDGNKPTLEGTPSFARWGGMKLRLGTFGKERQLADDLSHQHGQIAAGGTVAHVFSQAMKGYNS